MCAILGILQKKEFNQKLFKDMLELMNNRGKDNTGYYFSNNIYLVRTTHEQKESFLKRFCECVLNNSVN